MVNKLKILILSDDFPPQSFGGAGIAAFNLALGFKAVGHDVYVITTVSEKEKQGFNENQGLKIFKIYSHYHPRWRAYRSLYNPQTIFAVKKIIKNVRPDVVHAHNLHTHLSYHALKIAKQQAKAVFLTAHDAMLFHYGKLIEFLPPNPENLSRASKFNYKISPWQQFKRFKWRYNPFRNIIIRRYLKYVDKIFAISRAIKENLNQNGIKNVIVVYNGIDLEQWRRDEQEMNIFRKKNNLTDKKTILFGGRLNPLKGGEKIVLAMQKVVRQIPKAVLLVVGEKNNYAQVMVDLAHRLNIEKNIFFTGWLDRPEMLQSFFCCDLCATPSIYCDGFNLFNIEAMAAGKPVVGTCFGGTPEIVVDGVTGYVVNPFNIELLAEKITKLLSDEQKAREMGLAGQNRVKEMFNLKQQVVQILDLYDAFLADKAEK